MVAAPTLVLMANKHELPTHRLATTARSQQREWNAPRLWRGRPGRSGSQRSLCHADPLVSYDCAEERERGGLLDVHLDGVTRKSRVAIEDDDVIRACAAGELDGAGGIS